MLGLRAPRGSLMRHSPASTLTSPPVRLSALPQPCSISAGGRSSSAAQPACIFPPAMQITTLPRCMLTAGGLSSLLNPPLATRLLGLPHLLPSTACAHNPSRSLPQQKWAPCQTPCASSQTTCTYRAAACTTLLPPSLSAASASACLLQCSATTLHSSLGWPIYHGGYAQSVQAAPAQPLAGAAGDHL